MSRLRSMSRWLVILAIGSTVFVPHRSLQAQVEPTKPIGDKALPPGFAEPFPPPDPLLEFDLRLLAEVKNVDEIPRTGKKLILLARVGDVIQIRIFDEDGSQLLDSETHKLTSRFDLLANPREIVPPSATTESPLNKKLRNLWPPHELTASDKAEVIRLVSEIFELGRARSRMYLSSMIQRFEAIMAKEPAGPVDQELKDLLKVRRESAHRLVAPILGFYSDNRIGEDEVLDAMVPPLKSQLELLDSPVDQVAIYELLLEFARNRELREAAALEVGRVTPIDLEKVRFRRINCEIDLLKVKRKLLKE